MQPIQPVGLSKRRRNPSSPDQLNLFELAGPTTPLIVVREARCDALLPGRANAATADETDGTASCSPARRPKQKRARATRVRQETSNEHSMLVEDAAAFLSVSVKTLEAWRGLGKGPRFLKLGRAVRYTKAALELFMRARTVQNSAEGRMLDTRR